MGIHRQLWRAGIRLAHRHMLSQEVARRNAMTATTALMQHRRERDDVEQFLALHNRQYDARTRRAVSHRSA